MTLSILLAVLCGAFSGYYFISDSTLGSIDTLSMSALCFLIFLVGIDVGINKHVFKDLKKHGVMIILIPVLVILGTVAGGVLSGVVLGLPMNISLSVSSGFGWYSLSGILLSNLHSAEMGAVAFLTNVFRELITVVSVPVIARYFNSYSVIAPAGATSMDTTLPIISRYTDPEIAVISFFNGVLLSSVVPILVPFFYSI